MWSIYDICNIYEIYVEYIWNIYMAYIYRIYIWNIYMVFIYGIYICGILLGHKKGNFCQNDNMNGPGGHFVEWISLTEKDKYCRYHLYMESQKYNELVNKTENSRLMDTDNKLVVSSGEREEGRGREFFLSVIGWDWHIDTAMYKTDN